MMLFIDCVLKATLLLGISLAGAHFLRRQSAALRHSVLVAGLLCALSVPVLLPFVPALRWVPALPPAVSRVPSPEPPQPTPATAGAVTKTQTKAPTMPPSSAADSPNRRVEQRASPVAIVKEAPEALELPSPSAGSAWILATTYVAGVALSLGSLMLSLLRLARITRDSKTVLDKKWQRVASTVWPSVKLQRLQLLESTSPSILATWGVLRPKVIVPAGATDWTQDRIRAVLTHELAHVRRSDWLTLIAAEILRIFLWFNPVAWLMVRRLRHECELACDDAVLNRGMPAPEYAQHLLDVARILGSQDPSWAPSLLMARVSTFERRFTAMLNPGVRRTEFSGIRFVFILVASLIATVPLVALRQISPNVPAAVTSAVTVPGARLVGTVSSAVAAAVLSQSVPSPLAKPNSIEGIVVRLGTNEPLSEVDVQLARVEGTASRPLLPLVYPPGDYSPGAVLLANYPNPSDLRSVRTRTDGRFVFADLLPGKYRLLAARAGGTFYPAEFGQRNPKSPGYNFDFADGQIMAGVKLEMAATGVIAGRIVDLENRPARARVMAFEASYESGRRKLGVVETTVTDDRGEYRLFHLPPGRYFVGARALDPRQRTVNLVTYVSAAFGPVQESSTEAPLFMRAAENGETIEETYGLVFYGATEPERARPVDVGSGTTTATVDIDLSPARVRAYRIQGVAVDGNGSPVGGGTQVRAVPKVWLPSQIIPSANTDSNGNFEIGGLAPGQYTLRALSANTNANSSQRRVWGGHLPVEIAGADLRDVRFVMTSGLTLQGRIFFEGNDGMDASGLTISLQPDASLVAANTAVQANGTFNLSTVYPGEYRVSISPILTINTGPPYIPPRPIPAPFQDAYVKSIRLGVQDVLAGSVQIGSQTPGDFEIVIGTNGGLLEGVVVNKDRKGVPNATVALVPASTLRQRSDLYKSALTSAAGAFKLRAIAPGDYTLFAWEYAEPGIWHQSEFLRPFESSGKPIRISEGNNQSIELTLLEQR